MTAISVLKKILKVSRDDAEGDCIFCGCEQGSDYPDDCYPDCVMVKARKAIKNVAPDKDESAALFDYVESLENLAVAACEVIGGFAVSDGRGNEIVSVQAMNKLREAAKPFLNTVTPT